MNKRFKRATGLVLFILLLAMLTAVALAAPDVTDLAAGYDNGRIHVTGQSGAEGVSVHIYVEGTRLEAMATPGAFDVWLDAKDLAAGQTYTVRAGLVPNGGQTEYASTTVTWTAVQPTPTPMAQPTPTIRPSATPGETSRPTTAPTAQPTAQVTSRPTAVPGSLDDMPKTGDAMPVWLFVVAGAALLILVVVAAVGLRKKTSN